ncbi:MAG TPA: hypothetical protein VF517_12620 [Thermoleophilaceae bacterium]|jgi:hypothetical protein
MGFRGLFTLAAVLTAALAVPSTALGVRAPERAPLDLATGLTAAPLCTGEQTVSWQPAGAGTFTGTLVGRFDSCPAQGYVVRGVCRLSVLGPDGTAIQTAEGYAYGVTEPTACDPGPLTVGPLPAADTSLTVRFWANFNIRGPSFEGVPTVLCPNTFGPSMTCESNMSLAPGHDQAARFQ